jgi:hypothetical protein
MCLRDHARSIPEHSIPALERGRRRLPPARQASTEQFRRCRVVAPDGDRRHGTESRRIKNEVDTLVIRHHDIVGVFVLRDDLGYRTGRLLAACPRQDIAQRALLAQPRLELWEDARGSLVLRSDGNEPHAMPTGNSVEA